MIDTRLFHATISKDNKLFVIDGCIELIYETFELKLRMKCTDKMCLQRQTSLCVFF